MNSSSVPPVPQPVVRILHIPTRARITFKNVRDWPKMRDKVVVPMMRMRALVARRREKRGHLFVISFHMLIKIHELKFYINGSTSISAFSSLVRPSV
jgi:hypothetical protein